MTFDEMVKKYGQEGAEQAAAVHLSTQLEAMGVEAIVLDGLDYTVERIKNDPALAGRLMKNMEQEVRRRLSSN